MDAMCREKPHKAATPPTSKELGYMKGSPRVSIVLE